MVELSTDAVIIIAFLSFVSFVLLVVVVFLAAMLRRERADRGGTHRYRRAHAEDAMSHDDGGGGFRTPRRGGGDDRSALVTGHFSPRSVERFRLPGAPAEGGGGMHLNHHYHHPTPLVDGAAAQCVGSDLVIGRRAQSPSSASRVVGLKHAQPQEELLRRTHRPPWSGPNAPSPLTTTVGEHDNVASPRIPPPPTSQPQQRQQRGDDVDDDPRHHRSSHPPQHLHGSVDSSATQTRQRRLVSPTMSSVFHAPQSQPHEADDGCLHDQQSGLVRTIGERRAPSPPRVVVPPAPLVAVNGVAVMPTFFPSAILSPALSPAAQAQQTPVGTASLPVAAVCGTPPPPQTLPPSTSAADNSPTCPQQPDEVDGCTALRGASVQSRDGGSPSSPRADSQGAAAGNNDALGGHGTAGVGAAGREDKGEEGRFDGSVGCERPAQHQSPRAIADEHQSAGNAAVVVAPAAPTAPASSKRCKFCGADLQDPAVLAATCEAAESHGDGAAALSHASILKAMKAVKHEKKRIQQLLRSGNIEAGQRLLDELQDKYMAYL